MKLHIHSLSLRYLLTFSLCIIIPVIFSVIGINLVYVRSQRELTQIQMQETVNQMAESIGNEIDKIKILSSALSQNSRFNELVDLYSKEENSQVAYKYYDMIDLELSRLFLYTNKVGLICVYVKNKPVIMFKNSPLYSDLTSPPVLNKTLQKDIDSRPGILKLDDSLYSIKYEKEPHLSIALKPGQYSEGEGIDKIFYSYPLKLLSSISKSSTLDRFSFITNDDKDIILEPKNHNLSGILISQLKDNRLDSRRWILLNSKIPSTNWVLYQAVDVDEFTKPLYVIQRVFFVIIGGLILLFILYTALFFNGLVKPVNLLIESMSLVESGDYTVTLLEPRSVEMKKLIHSFNRMVERIGQLTNEKSFNEKEKSQLELQALQYQINPHFIANTLNSIRLMAVVRKNENIKNMTASLMQIINDSFRGEGNMTTIKEEQSSLKSYVHIMKVRFSSPIDLRFSIDPGLENIRIMKMLLQPIVENSVVHGFEGKKTRGVIYIKVKLCCGNNVKIIVIDNGTGFSEKIFSDKKNKGNLSSLTRVGIQNVDRRIKLNYGDTFGLNIESKESFYTKVTLLLPIIEGEKDD